MNATTPTRPELEAMIDTIAARVAMDLAQQAKRLLARLDANEIATFTDGEARKAYFLPKALIVSLADRIPDQFGSEGAKPLVVRLKAIHRCRS